jgi:signal recognition particle subunit SRP72
LCNASDELSEEDKAAEIIPMLVQQIYVLVRLGKLDEADELVASLSPSE